MKFITIDSSNSDADSLKQIREDVKQEAISDAANNNIVIDDETLELTKEVELQPLISSSKFFNIKELDL